MTGRDTLFWFCAAIVFTNFFSSKLKGLDGAHHVIAELGAGAAGVAARDGERLFREHAFVQRGGEFVRLGLVADVGQQHHAGAQHAARVCVLGASLLHHARRRAVNGLKHGVALADVAAARRAYAALEFGRFVSDDVAVQVGQHEHLKIGAALFVHQLGRHDVDIPVVRGDVGVLFAHGLAELQKLAVRGLDDVGFGNDGHAGFVVFPGKIIRELCNALRAVSGSDGEIHRDAVLGLEAAAAQGVDPSRVRDSIRRGLKQLSKYF